MNILRFIEQFPTEQSYRNDFKEKREKEDVYCKKCKSKDHYWSSSKEQWQCKNCKFRTTLRSGTIMEHSNLPFR
ncbi:MAG TPA: IS1595 family transposase, partial [Crocinitomix sp.]|nr:IS1595 family transposase [Crocinitomix sp.]